MLESTGYEVRSQLFMVLGGFLIILGIGLGIWLVQIVYTGIYHPEELPILASILEVAGVEQTILDIVTKEGTVIIEASEAVTHLVVGFALLILLGTLGGIVSGFISGGVKLLSSALEKKPRAEGGEG